MLRFIFFFLKKVAFLVRNRELFKQKQKSPRNNYCCKALVHPLPCHGVLQHRPATACLLGVCGGDDILFYVFSKQNDNNTRSCITPAINSATRTCTAGHSSHLRQIMIYSDHRFSTWPSWYVRADRFLICRIYESSMHVDGWELCHLHDLCVQDMFPGLELHLMTAG